MAWPPTIDDLRGRSSILTGAYPSPDGDVGLQSLLEEVGAVVSGVTARAIFFTAGGMAPTGCVYEDVPVELRPVAVRAIRMIAETDAVTDGVRSEVLENRASGLASISAGPWSESYFQPGATSGESPEMRLNANPDVSAALWTLLTECARSYWLYVLDPTRPREPASAVSEFDWFPESPVPFWPPYL